MNFVKIPDEILRQVADEALDVFKAVTTHLANRKWKVGFFVSPWSDAPYRPSLVAVKSGLCMLVEAQGFLSYHKTLKEYAAWLAAKRHYAELSLATGADCATQGSTLAEIRKDGVGWLVVDDEGNVLESVRPRNAALVITPDPTLKYGDCREDVCAALAKFNEINRKDGLRDMCEVVERETKELAVTCARRKLLKMNEAATKKMDWSTQINTLASPNAYSTGRSPIVDQQFKQDLHSFRGARNLVDHPVRTKHENRRRELQFADRMMQGPRLVAELVRLKRKVQ